MLSIALGGGLRRERGPVRVDYDFGVEHYGVPYMLIFALVQGGYGVPYMSILTLDGGLRGTTGSLTC